MTTPSIAPKLPLVSRRHAIIVGASSGIGEALARRLAQEGYVLALVARRESNLAEICDEINGQSVNGLQALYFAHDVTDYDQTAELFQRITAELGGLDLITYCAGYQPPMEPEEYDFAKDTGMVSVNLLGAMAWLGQAAQRFERSKAGHIVGISSIAAERGRRLNPGYNASKAGLDTYLEALRNRVSRHGVTVTTIRPGFVDTALLENAPNTMWVISPNEAASQIAEAIRRRKQTVYVPGRWRLVGLIVRHTPSVVFRRLNI